MHMTACSSSQVKAHGYDAATKTLAVQFHDGYTHHYYDVTASQYDELCKADSIDSYLPSFKKHWQSYHRCA